MGMAEAPHPRLAIERGTVVGRYVVIDKLGQGAMGEVFSAYDPELQRRVAIKLLSAQVRSSEVARARLTREAQSMARVSHPAVVPIFDVGTIDDEVFIAMELVEGTTLTEWLAAHKGRWREQVKKFIEAGRGLAAAHEAGVVHRDFKPDNVLIGHDGRARVTDFGIAVADGQRERRPAQLPPEEGALHRLTRTDTFLGTPAYLAPEQFDGAAVDGRSDQFSFCVALFEALYGHLPFVGTSPVALRISISGGNYHAPSGRSPVPTRVHKLLIQGLAEDPAKRHASMQVLLDALAKTVSRRTRWQVRIAAAAVVMAAVFVAVSSWTSNRALCTGSQAQLSGIWDEAARDKAKAAFMATQKPGAEGVFAGLDAALRTYSDAWVAMHTEACVDTRIRGEQPDAVMADRMRCLHRRRTELSALAEALTQADAPIVQRGLALQQALVPVSVCNVSEALSRQVKPPAAAIEAEVDALHKKLAAGDVLFLAGKWAEGLKAAKEVVAGAEALAYAPLRAEALLTRGKCEQLVDSIAASVKTLTEAGQLATAVADDSLAGEVWTFLAFVAATHQHELERAQFFVELGAAAYERAGPSDLNAFRLVSRRAIVFVEDGRFDLANRDFAHAIELSDKLFGPDYPGLRSHLYNSMYASLGTGELSVALERVERLQALCTKMNSTEDMAAADAYAGLALVQNLLGRNVEALANGEHALAIRKRIVGPKVYKTAWAELFVAYALVGLGRNDEAMRYSKSAAEYFETLPTTNSDSTHAHDALALALLGRGDDAQALDEARQTVEIAQKTLRPNHPERREYQRLLVRALVANDKADEAANLATEVAAAEEKAGLNVRALGLSLLLLGKAQMAQKLYPAAEASLGRALSLFAKSEGVALATAEARALLARIQWSDARSRASAQNAATEAAEVLRSDPSARKELAELEAWMDSLPPQSASAMRVKR